MSGEASGLRGRIRQAIEGPVAEAQNLLGELTNASTETKISILISGWGRGLAAGLEELAIAVEELRKHGAGAQLEPAASTAADSPTPQPQAQKRTEQSTQTSHEHASEDTLREQARESREQTAELEKETEQLRDELGQ